MFSVVEQDTSFSKKTLRLETLDLEFPGPVCMGVVNVTPDSFFSGSRSFTEKEILLKAEKHLTEGATFLDIGGYSSRPGAEDISVEDELNRVVPAIRLILKEFPKAIISIDTFRGQVASVCLNEGASIVNDISGGELDDNMFSLLAEKKPVYILMHMKGSPQTMKELTDYDNLLEDIMNYFETKVNRLQELNVKDIIIDPGFGFAKTVNQSYEILKNLGIFNKLKKPILAGVSRKSMIYRELSIAPEDALNGTTVLNTIALLNGANILRVHDVKEAMEAIKLINKIRN